MTGQLRIMVLDTSPTSRKILEVILRREGHQVASFGNAQEALRFLLRPALAIEGASIGEYENTFARLVGVRFASSFAAGRVGLYRLLLALGITSSDEVLVPAPTQIVVANAVRYSGARPVYVDCDPRNWNMDLRHVRSKVTPRTKAIILQHTFGIPADLDTALSVARQHRLRLIEDCVHALGAT